MCRLTLLKQISILLFLSQFLNEILFAEKNLKNEAKPNASVLHKTVWAQYLRLLERAVTT